MEDSVNPTVWRSYILIDRNPKGTRDWGIPFKVEVSLLSIICLPIYPSHLPSYLWHVSRDFLCLDEFLLCKLELSWTYEPLDSKGAAQKASGASFLPVKGWPESLNLVLSCKRLFCAATRVPSTLISNKKLGLPGTNYPLPSPILHDSALILGKIFAFWNATLQWRNRKVICFECS